MTIKQVSVHELKAMQEAHADFILLDVREPEEVAICTLQGKLIPLGQLPLELAHLDRNKNYVVHCKRGGRSQHAAELMVAAGFSSVANLTGGIDAWAAEIDPSMARY